MKYMSKERSGPAFINLCLRGVRAAIKRAEATNSPNALYLRSLETMAEAYRDELRRNR